MFKKLIVGFAVVALALVAVTSVSAATPTIAELMAQITQLQTLIAQLSGTGSTGASMTFVNNLTVGSTGPEVMALQNFLIGKGESIPAGATGTFGAQTKAALASFQMKNAITPAVGYFGPLTRAKVNAMGTVVTPTPGTPTPTPGSTSLKGGAGSVSDYTLVSGLNNEKVGEDEEDVEVYGLDIEADDESDIEITAIKAVFNEGTAGSDFEDYATEVSVWLDGDEVGRVDADTFTSENSWTRTISLDSGAIIRAGDTGRLTIAVSGISNLDTNDAADTWTIDPSQIRFVDARGDSTSEDPGTGARTFSFESFATATN